MAGMLPHTPSLRQLGSMFYDFDPEHSLSVVGRKAPWLMVYCPCTLGSRAGGLPFLQGLWEPPPARLYVIDHELLKSSATLSVHLPS